MSLVGILLITIGVLALTTVLLYLFLKRTIKENRDLTNELDGLKTNIVKLRSGYSNDKKAIEVQETIDQMIRGSKDEKEAKVTRNRIVDSISNGLQDYYSDDSDTAG